MWYTVVFICEWTHITKTYKLVKVDILPLLSSSTSTILQISLQMFFFKIFFYVPIQLLFVLSVFVCLHLNLSLSLDSPHLPSFPLVFAPVEPWAQTYFSFLCVWIMISSPKIVGEEKGCGPCLALTTLAFHIHLSLTPSLWTVFGCSYIFSVELLCGVIMVWS